MKEILYLVGVTSLALLSSEMYRRGMDIEGTCMLIGAVCVVITYYIEEN